MPSTPGSIVAGALFMIGATILMGVSLGTPHWLKVDIALGTLNFGLFRVCTNGECVDLDAFSQIEFSNIRLVQGLTIAAVVLYVCVLAVLCHLVCVDKLVINSKNHGWACLTLGIVGAILAWSGVGRFTMEGNDLDRYNHILNVSWKYGYSFYLAATSGVLGLLGCIVAHAGVSTLFNSRAPIGMVMQPTPVIHQVGAPINYGYPMAPQNAYPVNPYPVNPYPQNPPPPGPLKKASDF